MPSSKSVYKRERQNLARRARNKIIKSKVHTAYKRVMEALNEKNKEKTEEYLRNYFSQVDKAVKRKVLHRNNGARKKSRIVKKIKQVFNEQRNENLQANG